MSFNIRAFKMFIFTNVFAILDIKVHVFSLWVTLVMKNDKMYREWDYSKHKTFRYCCSNSIQ